MARQVAPRTKPEDPVVGLVDRVRELHPEHVRLRFPHWRSHLHVNPAAVGEAASHLHVEFHLRGVRRGVSRPAASALRHVQGCAWYRAAGRRLAARFVIAEASDMDVWWAERRLGLFELDSAPLGTAGQAVSGWVAKRGGRGIGFVRLVTIADAESPWKGHWLSSLTVRERYRGLGVGEALAWRAVEDAAARGVSAVWLGVREDNRSALGLSRKLEFEPVASDRPETTFAGEERAATRKHVILRKALEDRAVSA